MSAMDDEAATTTEQADAPPTSRHPPLIPTTLHNDDDHARSISIIAVEISVAANNDDDELASASTGGALVQPTISPPSTASGELCGRKRTLSRVPCCRAADDGEESDGGQTSSRSRHPTRSRRSLEREFGGDVSPRVLAGAGIVEDDTSPVHRHHTTPASVYESSLFQHAEDDEDLSDDDRTSNEVSFKLHPSTDMWVRNCNLDYQYI
eukprot:743522-Prorocentrum_minimum.AAC.7